MKASPPVRGGGGGARLVLENGYWTPVLNGKTVRRAGGGRASSRVSLSSFAMSAAASAFACFRGRWRQYYCRGLVTFCNIGFAMLYKLGLVHLRLLYGVAPLSFSVGNRSLVSVYPFQYLMHIIKRGALSALAYLWIASLLLRAGA